MKSLQTIFEEETGKDALIAVIGHGEKAYASWEYQVWLEKRVRELEQSPERVSVDAVVSGTQIVTELKMLLKKECNVCGNVDGDGWKDCGCHVQGVNEGIQKTIAIIEEKYH